MLSGLRLLVRQGLVGNVKRGNARCAIVTRVLSLPGRVLHLVRGFSFAGGGPGLVCVGAKRAVVSLRSSVLMAFLGLTKFSVLFFIPANCRDIRGCFTRGLVRRRRVKRCGCSVRIPSLGGVSAGDAHPS